MDDEDDDGVFVSDQQFTMDDEDLQAKLKAELGLSTGSDAARPPLEDSDEDDADVDFSMDELNEALKDD